MEKRKLVLAKLADRISGIQLPHPTRVAVDGIETSGKTTLARDLVPILAAQGRRVIHATVDDFRFPRAVRYRQGRFSPAGYYEDSVDTETLRERLLNPLGPNGTRRYRTASIDARVDRLIDPPIQEAPDDAILLLDGTFAFRPELNDFWDYRILVDISLEEARRRGIARDIHQGSQADILKLFDERFHPAQRRYQATVNPHTLADVIVDNTNLEEPGIRFLT